VTRMPTCIDTKPSDAICNRLYGDSIGQSAVSPQEFRREPQLGSGPERSLGEIGNSGLVRRRVVLLVAELASLYPLRIESAWGSEQFEVRSAPLACVRAASVPGSSSWASNGGSMAKWRRA
jgi:hypothetical protein